MEETKSEAKSTHRKAEKVSMNFHQIGHPNKKVSSGPSRFHEEFDNKITGMLKKFEDLDEAA